MRDELTTTVLTTELISLQRENAELRSDNVALKAYVERLREAIIASGVKSYGAMKLIDAQEIALNQTPPQSLRAHDMEIAERVLGLVEGYGRKFSMDYVFDAVDYVRNLDLSEVINE